MTDGWGRLIRDGHRAKGDLDEYLYEIPIPMNADEEGRLHGTVLLRLVAEPSPWPRASTADGESRKAETSWKFLLRTRRPDESLGDVISEPFSGDLPFVVSGLGPFDEAPEEEFDPDVLAARLLAYLSDWRNPEDRLSSDQSVWFQRLGPGVRALLPANEAQAATWVRRHRSDDVQPG
ncbi:hypothetical protein ACIG63_42575 [Streptomyces antimycoticus]|uniref:hypothetical protein n=1 Tax=Streptomyces antimycoticus TaxID=68175 RepID=UPI0037D31A3D